MSLVALLAFSPERDFPFFLEGLESGTGVRLGGRGGGGSSDVVNLRNS